MAYKIDYTEEERKIFGATKKIVFSIMLFGIFGFAALLLASYGMTNTGNQKAGGVGFCLLLGANLIIGSAAAAVGGLVGFLFGVPRTIDPASSAAIAGAAAQAGPAAVPSSALASNTNLERISDWLTTLLIGATLVQIRHIYEWISGLGGVLADGTISNQTLVPFLAVYFFTLGFMGVYLITRLYLTTALTHALSKSLGSFHGPLSVNALSGLKEQLAKAAQSSVPNELHEAISSYRNSSLNEAERADPELNFRLAGVAAKYLLTGQAVDSTDVREVLKDAIKKASANPRFGAQIASDLATGSLKTGDNTFDKDLRSLFST